MNKPKAETFLQLQNLHIRYGKHTAVHDFSLSIAQGEAVAIAGSNGAGKTSLLGAIAGIPIARQSIQGAIRLEQSALAWGDIQQHIKAGIRLVPEKNKVFSLLDVDENLRLGAKHTRPGGVDIDGIFHWFPRLAERRRTLAGNLSGGEQQMLGISISLLANPSLLLLDEPTLGLAVPIIEHLCTSLARLRSELNLTVLVAESDSQWLPQLATRAVVIDRGRTIQSFDHFQTADLDTIHDLLLGLAPETRDNREAQHA